MPKNIPHSLAPIATLTALLLLSTSHNANSNELRPIAPPPMTEDAFCYMQTFDGRMMDLTAMCGTAEPQPQIQPSNSVVAPERSQQILELCQQTLRYQGSDVCSRSPSELPNLPSGAPNPSGEPLG
jgi:hypothetical protein